MWYSGASLLIEYCCAGILPSEKRQCAPGHPLLILRINSPCLRWRSGRWHQQWPSRCFLFFLAQVSQYFVYGVLVFDASDHPHRTTTASANFDVDTEHTFQALGPGHCRMTFGRCADFCVAKRDNDAYGVLVGGARWGRVGACCSTLPRLVKRRSITF